MASQDRRGSTSAAERLRAMDGDATDGPSVDDVFESGQYRWPEPGEACLCADATAQLYWPRTGP